MKIVEKDWGHEIWFANHGGYCGKEIVCLHRKWSSGGKYHYHPIKDETFWIIEGTLLLDVEGKEVVLTYPSYYRIKPGVKHRFRSAGAYCRFIEVSTTHRDDDSIRVESL
jgi:mannose-6-phosphate isomerase-like protein (cupin superfamily)